MTASGSQTGAPVVPLPETAARAPSSTAHTVRWKRALVARHGRAIAGEAALVWVVTRLAYALYTWLSAVYGTVDEAGMAQAHNVTMGPAALLTRWNQWDARFFYLPIAAQGYALHAPIDSAFFPLYPLLVRAVWLPLFGPAHSGGALLLCALLVGNLGTLLAYAALALLAAAEIGAPAAVGALLRTVTCYPLAFFLVAPYPMGWLLAGVAGALLCARLGWWRRAMVCVAVATLSHPLGVVVALPVLWEWLAMHGEAGKRLRVRVLCLFWRRPTLSQFVPLLLAAPLALGTFLLYCHLHYHDWHSPFTAEEQDFGYMRVWPWTGLALLVQNIWAADPFGSYRQLRVLTDALPLLGAIVLAFTAWWRRALPGSFLAFCGALVLLWICSPVVGQGFSDTALADGRHVLVAVPLFLLVTRWVLRDQHGRVPWRGTAWAMGGLLLQAVLLAFYLGGGWIV